MSHLTQLLQHNRARFHPVISPDFLYGTPYIFNLTSTRNDFKGIPTHDTSSMIKRTHMLLTQHQATIGIGRYAEKRELYQHTQYLSDSEPRCIHLGIDLSVPTLTPVFCPFHATVHSFQDNDQSGDYGPTIILKHHLDNIVFYTLYGHLTQETLSPLKINQTITAGTCFAAVGASNINGNWPPHLHFQLIDDIGQHKGDYPGVCTLEHAAYYLANCPDPNLILQIDTLDTENNPGKIR